MNSFAVIAALLALAVIALIISSIAHQRYTEERIKKRNLKALKVRALQLEEMLEGLARTPCKNAIRDAIGECLVDTLQDIKDEDPIHPGIDIVIAATKQLMLLPTKSIVENDGPAESNRDIKRLQRTVLATITQIKKILGMGRITHADAQEWIFHMHMIFVQIEIDAHMMQGKKALDHGDTGSASTHFRVAQTKLAQSKYHGETKKLKIKEIGDLIHNIYHH